MNLDMLCTTFAQMLGIGDKHGLMLKWIFLEGPSQMFENWCWQPEILRKLSGHYQDTSKPLPDELIKNIIRSKNVGLPLAKLRQTAMSLYDLKLHTDAPISKDSDPNLISEIYNKMKEEISLIAAAPGTNFVAVWQHMVGGYDAGYYGYLWSEIYAYDMFGKFETEGPLNREAGSSFRKKVLEPGASKDGMDLLIHFLGRKPTEEAYFAHLGLNH